MQDVRQPFMGVQIRKATVDDIPGMKSFFNAHVAPFKSSYFFQWWNNIPSVTYCAVEAGEIIGLFVLLKRKLNNDLNCGVLKGLLVKPSWRGKGLFKELGDNAMRYFEDIDVFCCVTNKIGKRACEKNFGFRIISNIETMVFTGNADANSNYICTPIDSNTRFDNFDQGKEDPLMFLANNEFRQWRFAAHPRFSYKLLQTDSEEFVIIKTYYDEEKGIKYGDIVDFECQKVEEKRLHDLLNCACSCLKKDADIVTIQAIPGSFLYKAVKQMGFVESNMEHFLCLKVAEQQYEYLYNASDWLIKWGDYLR